MPRPPFPLTADDGPLAVFALELRALRERMGPTAPDPAQIAKKTNTPRATLYAALRGQRVPTRDVLATLVKEWGGNLQEWMARRSKVERQMALIRQPRKPKTSLPQLSSILPSLEQIREMQVEQRQRHAEDTRTAFAAAMALLLQNSRMPPVEVAKKAAELGYSLARSTIHSLVRGQGTPRWRTVETFIRAVKNDDDSAVTVWRGHWEDLVMHPLPPNS